MTDMGTNMSDVEARPHSDGIRVITLDANIQTPLLIVDVMIPTSGEDQIALPQINLSISGYGPNSLRDSQLWSSDVRAQEISILPQVDGPISAPTREYTRGRISESARIMEWEYSQGGTYIQGAPITQRRENLQDNSDDSRSHRGWRPPERGRYPNQNGRLPDRGRYPDRNRRPPRRGGYPGGGPPDGGGPSDDGGPPDGKGGPPGPPSGQGPPGPQGPPRQVKPVIVQTPHITLDTSALEVTFDTVGQSKLQLARVQDQTNRLLQQHIQ